MGGSIGFRAERKPQHKPRREIHHTDKHKCKHFHGRMLSDRNSVNHKNDGQCGKQVNVREGSRQPSSSLLPAEKHPDCADCEIGTYKARDKKFAMWLASDIDGTHSSLRSAIAFRDHENKERQKTTTQKG